jgi:hypothetical protein
MRAILAFLLLIAMFVLPLGCGGGGEGTEPEPDVSTPEALEAELPPPGEGGP